MYSIAPWCCPTAFIIFIIRCSIFSLIPPSTFCCSRSGLACTLAVSTDSSHSPCPISPNRKPHDPDHPDSPSPPIPVASKDRNNPASATLLLQPHAAATTKLLAVDPTVCSSECPGCAC
ncbi:hypothetical protein BCV70DRAFT_92304 [Testicularia cyperi]|uniref:Uncharacterized protein n=1 Tax=Testicularia cyperi TaxID=1882483 RepID=A0A317XI72_9BASI|nr:hypothetical protein BCV70DRAFT_92304 [Testicularia cyperi]